MHRFFSSGASDPNSNVLIGTKYEMPTDCETALAMNVERLVQIEKLVADFQGVSRMSILIFGASDRAKKIDNDPPRPGVSIYEAVRDAYVEEQKDPAAAMPKFHKTIRSVRESIKHPTVVRKRITQIEGRNRKLDSASATSQRKRRRRKTTKQFNLIHDPSPRIPSVPEHVDRFPSELRIPVLADPECECRTVQDCFRKMRYTVVSNPKIVPSLDKYPKHFLDHSNAKKDTKAEGNEKLVHDLCGAECRLSDDCKRDGNLGQFNGVPCRSVDCTFLQCNNAKPRPPFRKWRVTLYHGECLIKFCNGVIRVCGWCVVHFHIVSFQFSAKEGFSPTLNPNLRYEPWQHFSLTVSSGKKEQFCLHRAILADRVLYHLVRYETNAQLKGNAFFLIPEKFNTKNKDFISWETKSVLTDKTYEYSYYCPFDDKVREIEVLIKTQAFDGFCNNIVQFQDLWPEVLQRRCGLLALIQLLNLTRNDVLEWMREHPDEPYELWANLTDFKMIFGGFVYKENNSRLDIDQWAEFNNFEAPNGEFAVFELHGADIFQKTDDLDDVINRFYDHVFNPFVQQIAKDIPELAHWSEIRFVWQGMKELLLYSRNASRHVDTPFLFDLDVVDPSDGAFTLNHNFVKATLTNDSQPQVNTERGKKAFCIYSHPKCNVHHCHDQAIRTNHHYSDLKKGSMLAAAYWASKQTAHKVEHCGRAVDKTPLYTCLTMSRNYGHNQSRTTFSRNKALKLKNKLKQKEAESLAKKAKLN